MQLFVRADRTLSLQADASSTVATLKTQLRKRAGIAEADQRLVYAGRQLQDAATLQACGLQPDATLHLVLRLVGGKGGFGALLRAGARATVSQNTDACRDLSGRRMRHVNADKKLEEWQAEAKERELEAIALRHIKAEAKAADRASRAEVDVDAVRQEQRSGLARAQETMGEVVSTLPRGVKRDAASDSQPQEAKRMRVYADGLADSGSDSESDGSDVEELPASTAAAAAAAPAAPAALAASSAGAAAVAKDPPQATRAQQSSGPAQARLGQDTSAAVAAAGGVDRQASVTSPKPKPAREASVASNVQEALHPLSSSSGASAATASAAASLGQVASSVDVANEAPAAAAVAAPAAVAQDLDWTQFPDAASLEALGMDQLKVQLQAAGLKCGGSLGERAARLFLLRDHTVSQLDRKHLAKFAKK